MNSQRVEYRVVADRLGGERNRVILDDCEEGLADDCVRIYLRDPEYANVRKQQRTVTEWEDVANGAGHLHDGQEAAHKYADLSYRERVICQERDRGITRDQLAERFNVSPERIAQYEIQARRKLASLPLTLGRLEDLIDSTIARARLDHRPNLAIRAEVLAPYRSTIETREATDA